MDLDQIYQERIHLACLVRMHETFFLEVRGVVTVYFSYNEMVAERLRKCVLWFTLPVVLETNK